MNKRFVILIIVFLILVIGIGFIFYFLWQGGPELRSLNKSLPEGIKVEKREGKRVLVNKIDNYIINIPEGWRGIEKTDYKRVYDGSVYINKNNVRGIFINVYHNEIKKDFKSFVEEWIRQEPGYGYIFTSPEIPEIIGIKKIRGKDVIIVKDVNPEPKIGIRFFYYFKTDSGFYELYGESQEDIECLILNGNFNYEE